ncbi:MAG: DUF4421 domain-containing protein [Bacteroidales bacterium]|nr:DUF4421 domain-containing protein [Bacteroidales bacterium]
MLGLASVNAEPRLNVKDKIQQIKLKMAEPFDTTRDSGYWKRALQHGKLDINDTTVTYPSFLNLCVNVYRWGDKAFNSYDTTYVVGTRKNWKLMLKNNNWLSSFNGNLYDDTFPISMHSNVTSSFGLQLSFMAVSLSYMFNLNDLLTGNKVKNKKFDFSFTCSRLYLSSYYYRDDFPYYIHKFARYTDGLKKDYEFDGVSRTLYGANLFYIFNHKRYAQAAPYCFSKYQRKSSGSFMAGIHAFHEDVNMDYTQIKEEHPEYEIPDNFSYKYDGYSLLFGYGYNWVLGKHWLFNITTIPGVGYRHTYSSSSEGKKDFWSFDYRAKMALILNKGKFFYGLHLLTEGRWYLTKLHSLFSANHDLNVTIGFRF